MADEILKGKGYGTSLRLFLRLVCMYLGVWVGLTYAATAEAETAWLLTGPLYRSPNTTVPTHDGFRGNILPLTDKVF